MAPPSLALRKALDAIAGEEASGYDARRVVGKTIGWNLRGLARREQEGRGLAQRIRSAGEAALVHDPDEGMHRIEFVHEFPD